MLRMLGAAALAGLTFATQAYAVDAPAEIKIGTLYASSGRYASISMPVYSALKLWVEQKNADGGVYVKAFDKKLPVKLVSYDDQSNTATASTLYNQLVTQDKVDLLVADSGSVLTAPAVAIEQAKLQRLLEPLDLHGERRLGDMKKFGRPGEAAELGHRDEGSHLPQADIHS